MLNHFSHVWLFAIPPGSSVHGILRQEYWSRLSCPLPRDLPDTGINSTSLISPGLAGEFFTTRSTCQSRRYKFTDRGCLAWRILIITLLACWDESIEHFLAFPLFQTGMKTDLFQSCGHCWVFQICWHIECSIFTASSFRIWKSATGIPSPPLALLIVMFPKAYFTSHSWMFGSRWVITPSWLSGSWRSFLYSSFVYSCHLFLISFASVRFLPFLSFIEHIFAWNILFVSLIFLKRSLVFPMLLFPFISLHWSLRKAFLSLFPILWISVFKWVYISFSPLLFTSLLFTAICKASSDNHFAFWIYFSLGWSWFLFPVQYHEPPSIVHQAVYQCSPLNLFLTSSV